VRGADVVAETLSDQGVEAVFSLSGNQIMSIYDALLDTGIRIVHARHEGAAGFMAEGYAQIARRPGVALVTAGSGLGNAIAPLITSSASQTPLVLISGDSPVALDGQGAFQEMPQIALTAPLTKWSVRITDPAQIASTLAEAIWLSEDGRPGPVHVSLPDDVLKADAQKQGMAKEKALRAEPGYGPLSDALSRAEKPLILLGPGVPQPDNIQLPILRLESPRGGLDPSLGQFKQLWTETDLVVALGKPLDFSVGFGAEESWPKARWITVHGDADDVRRAENALGARLLLALRGRPGKTVEAIAGARLRDPDWLDRVSAVTRVTPPVGQGLTSATLCQTLANHIANRPNAVFISDGGEIGQWGQAFVRAPQRIINGTSGTIGAGICYAIGAQIAAPEAEVVVLMGDGTAGFHFAEFETAAREHLPVKAVIGNDQRWNAEHQLQLRSFGADRAHSCQLSDADYAAAAEAFGAKGIKVEACDALADALEHAAQHEGPVCLDVRIEGLPAPQL